MELQTIQLLDNLGVMQKIIFFLLVFLFTCQSNSKTHLKNNVKMNHNILEELKQQYSIQYNLLQNPKTWCKGADQLSDSNDSLVLLMIIEAYLLPIEHDKICLLNSMQKLGGSTLARQLWEIDNFEIKRLTLHLMRLFPHENHLEILFLALKESTEADSSLIIRTLINQIRNREWENVMLKSLKIVSPTQQQNLLMELEKSKTPEVLQKIKEWQLNNVKGK